ncbi:putative (R)-2-hydroxyglutaryl-CoA dehydratase activator [Tissierellia bacterium KA00581]|nr:putative (R)-2-hydroxyglutaryl-CoA dehydratase activator [Tissierellia bacterium KA00581]
MNIGIDIGSTASKVIVFDREKEKIVYKILMPTGWNSKETSFEIYNRLKSKNFDVDNSYVVATGYGRISVPYANRIVTEITTHAKGAMFLLGKDCDVIDIGGQDTKIINITNKVVTDFIMNDKCSAGTGKFLEVMSNRLGITLEEMFEISKKGNPAKISSTCTVFAESEVISLMGEGRKKEDIASGVIHSIANKVVGQTRKFRNKAKCYFLTGGFSNNEYMVKLLSELLETEVKTHKLGRFAGAIGAALMGKK